MGRGQACPPRYPPAMTLFEKIMRGDIPCHKVYADDHAFAFLDINPIAVGHTLVVPRQAVPNLDQLSPESAAGVGRALVTVAAAVARATNCPAYNILFNNGADAGQVVMHAHFHVIPKPAAAHAKAAGPGSGLAYDWPTSTLSPAEGTALAARIAAAM